MTRIEWLQKQHRDIDSTVTVLENQRETIRSPNHKATLQDLKKQKLAIKTELEMLLLTVKS